jgi:hypothetical protein
LVESIVTIAGGRSVDGLAEAVAHLVIGVTGLLETDGGQFTNMTVGGTKTKALFL